jgi:hypothetical protein
MGRRCKGKGTPRDDRALKPQRTKLYDRTGDAVALDEVERIAI